MAVYKKILEMQKRVKSITKDSKGFNYDYISGDKLLNIVRPIMDELSLILLPEVMGLESEKIIYDQYDRRSNQMLPKTENLVTLQIKFTWIDCEDGEKVPQMWAGTGQNDFDKGFGSALTYGERYYLLKVLHIATDRDDVDRVSSDRNMARQHPADQQAAPVTKPAGKATRKSAAAQAQTKQAPAADPQPEKRTCDKETLLKFVVAEAKGDHTPKGKTSREAFVSLYNPSEKELSDFDLMVANYKQAQAKKQENK